MGKCEKNWMHFQNFWEIVLIVEIFILTPIRWQPDMFYTETSADM